METQNAQVPQITVQTENHNQQPSVDEIQNWLVSHMAEILEIAPNEVNVNIPFDEYGMDSTMTVGMAGELGDWLGCNLEPTLTYDYPTIDSMARHLGLVLTSGVQKP